MTDIFDRATELELRQREHALAAHAARRPTQASLSHCRDCGEDIPLARQLAARGCTRCIDCETRYEQTR